MALIGIIERCRKKPLPKKWMVGVFLFFLWRAFYGAWQEQAKKAEFAATENDKALRQTHEYWATIEADRRTIEGLTVALIGSTNRSGQTSVQWQPCVSDFDELQHMLFTNAITGRCNSIYGIRAVAPQRGLL